MGSSIARVCLVLLIPINLLRSVQIDLRQKLAVAGIFSLTLFIIAVAIMRVTLNSTNKSTLDLSLINLWAVLELTVVISAALYEVKGHSPSHSTAIQAHQQRIVAGAQREAPLAAGVASAAAAAQRKPASV
jgi:uncharacterized protein YhhL (DUF1145 family)